MGGVGVYGRGESNGLAKRGQGERLERWECVRIMEAGLLLTATGPLEGLILSQLNASNVFLSALAQSFEQEDFGVHVTDVGDGDFGSSGLLVATSGT